MISTNIAIRWSDLDPLKHVNNVQYVDYALEVWPDLRSNGLIPSTDPRHVQVEYRQPVLRIENSIHIESSFDSGVLTQTMFIVSSTEPVAIVTSHFDRDVEVAQVELRCDFGALALRFSDLDDHGQINPARLFEFFQECRSRFIRTIVDSGSTPTVVVARTDVFPIEPIRLQSESLGTQTWIKRLGDSSFVVRAQLCNENRVLAVAETVAVLFDPETQKAVPLDQSQRENLQKFMLST